MEEDTEINELGNTVIYSLPAGRDRYLYEREICPKAAGWRQYATPQDGRFFGVWIHDAERTIVTYIEGEEWIIKCPTEESFRAELDQLADFHR